MAGPTNLQLQEQITKVADDVAELREWLKPLANGTGAKVSKIAILVSLAEEGQQARQRREILEGAADILFGWMPQSFRRVGAALAIVFGIGGGVSGIGWAVLSMIQIWHLIHK